MAKKVKRFQQQNLIKRRKLLHDPDIKGSLIFTRLNNFRFFYALRKPQSKVYTVPVTRETLPFVGFSPLCNLIPISHIAKSYYNFFVTRDEKLIKYI